MIILQEGQKYKITVDDKYMIYGVLTVDRKKDEVYIKVFEPYSSHQGYRLSSIEEKENTIEIVDFAELKEVYFKDAPELIKDKIGRELYQKANHPICIVKDKINDFFSNYELLEFRNPMVSIGNNFDNLLIPKEHPGRKESDTFYSGNKNYVLRTHTTAHQTELLKKGLTKFIVTGDVYRRDTIDASHFPVFHQVEGVNILGNVSNEVVIEHLKDTLSGLIKHLFGNDVKYRFIDEYFPFTEPSFEVEVEYKGKEMEVLGSGVIHKDIMKNCGLEGQNGWAFGMGLERLAMIFFDIPDIRYFWSEDQRFLSQFKAGEFTKFQSYSKYPSATRDISMWVPEGFEENYFFDLVRDFSKNLVEEVSLIDSFTNSKTNRSSKTFRINFCSLDRTLTGEEIDEILNNIKTELINKQCEIR